MESKEFNRILLCCLENQRVGFWTPCFCQVYFLSLFQLFQGIKEILPGHNE